MNRFALLAAFFLATPAFAQETEPQLLLEYPEGPVVNSNRVMGLGGAYVGVAEGGDGHLYNPASFAYRYHATRNDIWDWDWSLYWLNLSENRNPDLYGRVGETEDSSWFGGGLDLKLAGFGFGVHAYTQGYGINPQPDEAGVSRPLRISNTSVGFGLAYALHTLDLTLGAYVYAFGWAASTETNGLIETALSTFGAGSRVGLLWAPRRRPLRIGVVYRTSFNATGVREFDADVFERAPDGVYLPGQLSIGGSIMAGERRYNPNMTWGLAGLEDERPTEPGDDLRRYVMVAYDIVIKEPPPPGTLSMRGYFHNSDDAHAIRQDFSYAFRGGIESEVWANWLQLRAGYYFEPTRTFVVRGRHHVTGGFAFRIPAGEYIGFWPWDLRLDAAIDFATNYLNWGVGVGFWH